MNRRKFIGQSGAAMAGAVMLSPMPAFAGAAPKAKLKLALVGTGIRGITFWGKTIRERYGDLVEYVGLCDINPGRVEFGKKFIGANCPTFTNFEEMVKKTRPDMLIVTTVDATHHEYIIKGLDMGLQVLTEKPLTTDEDKCRRILEAEKRSGKKLIVGFNYRYNPHYTKIKELLDTKRVGDITSVDFHWYLNTYHGASYFRRWHGLREKGGTLLVHKSTHHFDLLNWWLDSDPVEVMAYGDLQHYGANNPFRGDKSRTCEHKKDCKYYWDITKDKMSMNLYVDHEEHDGYIRDNCLWRPEIDIYDRMSVQVRYANNVLVNYSLTTYSPYEGMKIAFNGYKGRIDAWDGIPWRKDEKINQAQLHAQEMTQTAREEEAEYEEIIVADNFGDYELVKVPRSAGGHGGGDIRLQNRIFKDPNAPDPFHHAAGSRDGAFSILVGVAARKSIEESRPVKISELTDLKPQAVRPKNT
jgi:predicted dehydrogenase